MYQLGVEIFFKIETEEEENRGEGGERE